MCVFEGGTSESQVFVSQRGEALLQGLLRHLLQCGRVPPGTLVLVHQHCRHAEFHNTEEESDGYYSTFVDGKLRRLTGSNALIKVAASLQKKPNKPEIISFQV